MVLDPTTRAVIETIPDAGLCISVRFDKSTCTATAQGPGGETCRVTANDAHAAVVELAHQTGLELLEG